VSEVTLPPTVPSPFGGSVRDYWLARAAQHTRDTYAGVPLSKFPEDLRVYEHLLWQAPPRVVIEVGSQFGGSSLWFRDRLADLVTYGKITDPLVIAIDLDIELVRETLDATHPDGLDGIELIGGDVTDPELPMRVEKLLRPDDRCLVIEDSAHEYDTTLAALRGFARFVSPGGFFVVEDGCVDVDEMRIEGWPRGVLPALHDWLESEDGAGFSQRRDLELYGITCHPEGFLQRAAG
jgi:cephalosporin hydroxylase